MWTSWTSQDNRSELSVSIKIRWNQWTQRNANSPSGAIFAPILGYTGGKPCIAGTRIRVWDVHIWHPDFAEGNVFPRWIGKHGLR